MGSGYAHQHCHAIIALGALLAIQRCDVECYTSVWNVTSGIVYADALKPPTVALTEKETQ